MYLSDDTVMISLLSLPPVKYKLGDTSFTPITGLPNYKSLVGVRNIGN